MSWLLGFLGVIVLSYVGLCLFYFVFQERFIFLRFRTRSDHRYTFPNLHEERWLERPDGALLHALYFGVTQSKGVVLYFHGHSGSVRRWGNVASRFTGLGFDVLMPDPRGYGKSTGPSSEASMIADAVAWYDELTQHRNDAAIVLYGRSMGGAYAVPVAAQRKPRMLILETPFANLRDVARSYLPILPYRWLLRYPFRNDLAMRQVHCPVFIFHGLHDQVVPYASALKLYAAVPSSVRRELFTFAKGRHNNLYRFGRFRNTLRRLLLSTESG